MALTKNFVIRNGLEVGLDLIYADSATKKVGIGSTVPEYNFDVRGDLALDDLFLVGVTSSLVKVTTGIASATSPGVISGIDTSLIRINDTLTESNNAYFAPSTRVVSVGASIVNLNVAHKNGIGSTTLTITINRRVTSGNQNNVLVSRGEFKGPEWKQIEEIVAINTEQNDDNVNYNVVFAGNPEDGVENTLKVDANGLVYNPFSNRLGIGVTPNHELDVIGDASISGDVTSDTLNVDTQSTLAAAEATSLTVTPGLSNLSDVTAASVEATSYRIGAAPSLTNFQIDNYNLYTQMGVFNASITPSHVIDSYDITNSDFKISEYTLHIRNIANNQAQKVLAMQDGTNAFSEEYGIIYHPDIIVSIGATISGTTFQLIASANVNTTGNVRYRFIRHTLL